MAASTPTQLRFLTDAAHLLRQSAPETSAFLMSRRTAIVAGTSSGAPSAGQPSAAVIQTATHRQHVCTCCGHILIPGCDGTSLAIQSGRSSRKDKKTAKRKRNEDAAEDHAGPDRATAKPAGALVHVQPHSGVAKIYTCGACARETRVALPPPPPLSKQRRRSRAADNKAAEAKTAEVTAAESKTAVPPVIGAPAKMTSTATATAAPTASKPSSNANSKKRAKNRKTGLLALLDKSKADSSGFGGLGLSFDDFRKK